MRTLYGRRLRKIIIIVHQVHPEIVHDIDQVHPEIVHDIHKVHPIIHDIHKVYPEIIIVIHTQIDIHKRLELNIERIEVQSVLIAIEQDTLKESVGAVHTAKELVTQHDCVKPEKELPRANFVPIAKFTTLTIQVSVTVGQGTQG